MLFIVLKCQHWTRDSSFHNSWPCACAYCACASSKLLTKNFHYIPYFKHTVKNVGFYRANVIET